MISSIRFRNSGLNSFFTSPMTRDLISLSERPALPSGLKPSVVGAEISRAPTLDVMMMTVLRKSTVRPWASVRLTFLEDLQQNVEHIGMRLLDLVEQHHRIRALTHGLR